MVVKPLRARAIALFHEAFAATPRAAASAPGRVHLLGEHTHYNGGPVLLIATRERTAVAVGPGEAGVLEVVAGADGQRERVRFGDGRPQGWAGYAAAVMHELGPLGAAPANGGARVAVSSDLPAGAGFASSAALAVAAAGALTALAGARLTTRQLAGVAFRAEHDHVGARCGVMDHAIAALARPGRALLVECASAEGRLVPFGGGLLLVDAGARPDEAARVLEQRQAECEAAVARLKLELPELYWLASWPAGWLARLKKALREPLRSRAVHIVGETARARFGAELLARRRLERFGELLYESHESSRRLYDWSAPEADLVVTAAKRAGALGARLTGFRGFGTVLVLLRKGDDGKGKRAGKIAETIRSAFAKAYRREPGIRVLLSGGGARREAVR